MNIFRSLFILIICSIFFSCDAPHLNPLDPQNPDYSLGQLSGTVVDATRQPLKSVKVIFKIQNVVAETDASGNFKMEDVPMKNGWLYFEKDGYGKDSLEVKWNNQKNKNVGEKSLAFTIGLIDGYVFTFPRVSIAGVKVIFKNQNLITETDATGYFKLENASMKNGMIYFEKYGFAKDSTLVQWGSEKNKRIDDKYLSSTVGQIDGYVKGERSRSGIPGVKVFWKNQNLLIQTDATGYYKLINIPKQNGTIYFEKDGYGKDSSFVQWGDPANLKLDDELLNSNPVLNNLFIYTVVENKYPDIQKITMSIQADVSDLENDIDSIFVRCNSLNVYKRLVYNYNTQYFERSFSPSDLNLSSMDDAIGKNFEIIVKDTKKKIFNIGSSNVKRIIRQEVLPDLPANKQTVGVKPTLRWKRFEPGFNFRYMVQIYTDEIPASLVWERDYVSKDAIDIVPEISLTPGDYFWVVWCIDDFQNRGKSKPASFIVQ